MPIFRCSKCGCGDNTALGNYWVQQLDAHKNGQPFTPLCTECDPAIGRWHWKFQKAPLDESRIGPDGFRIEKS